MPYAESVFSYCPRCGEKSLRGQRPGLLGCSACGLEFFTNVAAAVGAVFSAPRSRILLIRRSRDPGKGLLDFPGGFVDPGEDAMQALRREVLEELGIEVHDPRLLASAPNEYEYGGITYRTLDFFFACRGDLRRATPREEIQEMVYRSPRDIAPAELAFDSLRRILPVLAADSPRSGAEGP